jgi:hypothetical protein
LGRHTGCNALASDGRRDLKNQRRISQGWQVLKFVNAISGPSPYLIESIGGFWHKKRRNYANPHSRISMGQWISSDFDKIGLIAVKLHLSMMLAW